MGDDAALFKQTYNVTAGGNWEGRTILNRSRNPALGDAATEVHLSDLRQKLLKVRDKRIWPGWDDKVLADWNGLMITALDRGGNGVRRAGLAERRGTRLRLSWSGK